MFIKKITICNIFAYYQQVEVNFCARGEKNLYCIYGDNGYGKTSFIRCAKLLFLGAGLLGDGVLHPVIARFAKGKIKKPYDFIKGSVNWGGILNTKGVESGESDFFIQFEGEIDKSAFEIRRSWIKEGNDFREKLIFKIGDETLEGEDAQDRLNFILPPNFVEFFFFDGEEIEDIGDGLKSDLQKKILEIFQISPLELIVKQSQKIRQKKFDEEMENKEKQNEYRNKQNEIESLQDKLLGEDEIINRREKEIREKEEELRDKRKRSEKILKDESSKLEGLLVEKQEIQKQLIGGKDDIFESSIKSVHFLSAIDLLGELEKLLQELETKTKTTDIEAIERLIPDIKEVFKEKLSLSFIEKSLSPGILHKVSFIVEDLPNELKSRISQSLPSQNIPHIKASDLKAFVMNLKSIDLKKKMMEIRDLKIKLKDLEEDINQTHIDEIAKEKKERLDAEISELEDEIKRKKEDLESKKKDRAGIRQKLEELEGYVSRLENETQNERIQAEMKVLECVTDSLNQYKSELIDALKLELKGKIFENYKKLSPNDNISNIEIVNDFEIQLQDDQASEVLISNQSSGQKQVLAIAIFWAIKEISKSKMPLIIDTPLARIDLKIRKNIIQNYYANASHQVIFLPHGTEMREEEYEYAKPYLADFYQIRNSENRNTARIESCSYEEMEIILRRRVRG